MQRSNRQIVVRERGIYLTLVAVFGLILLGLTALVIDLGLIAIAHTRLQQVVNLAALSAIEQYVRYVPTSGDTAPETTRRARTEARANAILQANSVWGLDSTKLEVRQSLGSIEFGRWHRFDPDGPGGVACEKYPCFVLSTDAITQGNAVRLRVSNASDNPFARFFGAIFGPATVTVEADATATLVKRCMAFLVDLSLSATADSHPLPPRGLEPTWLDAPDPLRESVGFFGDPEDTGAVDVVQSLDGGVPTVAPGSPFPLPFPRSLGLFAYVDPPEKCNYDVLTPPGGGVNYSALLWCSLLKSRPPDTPVTMPEIDYKYGGYHTRSDYRLRTTPFQQNQIYFDLNTRPEPFSTFLLGFNAALRSVYAEASNADEAMIAGFSKSFDFLGVQRRYPKPTLVPGGATKSLTNNLPLLVHLTNIENIGKIFSDGTEEAGLSPSLIDLGLFPVYSPTDAATATNLPRAISDAVNALDASCGPSDRKIIVVATDGISNCREYGNSPATCRGNYLGYVNSENQLLSLGATGTLRKLIDRQVALTVLHAGVGVRPNYRTIETQCPDPRKGQCLLDYDGALRGGYTGGISSDFNMGASCDIASAAEGETPRSYVNCGSRVPPGAECASPPGPTSWSSGCEFNAFNALGRPGVYFGRPAAAMARLAMESGGRYCPILPIYGAYSVHNTNYVDHDGDEPSDGSICRGCTPRRLRWGAVEGLGTSPYSLELLTPGEQAGECARLAVGGSNPFTLVEE